MDAQERQRQFAQLENNTNYRCCCGAMSAAQGANIFAIISLVFHFFLTLLSFVIWLLLPFDIVTLYQILIAILVLVGHSKHSPELYLASLILQAIYLIPASLLLLGAFIASLDAIFNGNPLVALFFAVCLPILLIYVIYFDVVYKAYKYMKAEKQWLVENPPAPGMAFGSVVTYTTTTTTQPQNIQNPSTPQFAAPPPLYPAAINKDALKNV